MAADRDDFLRRWSRRKQAAAAQAPAPKPAAADAAPKLPSIDSLTFESDFKAFMHAKVEQSVKRAALKKLFADPRFNVIDFMDVYIDDYTNLETIPPEMLARLEHAKGTLFGREERKEEKQGEALEDTQLAQAPVSAEESQEAKPEQAKPREKEPGKDDGAAG